MDYSKYKGRPSPRLEGVDYGEQVTYAVTFNTKGRVPHFKDPRLAASLLSIIIGARLEVGFCVYAYCIMPDHVHLMVQPRGAATLPRIVRSVKGRMTVVFRKFRPGVTLWQRGYVDNPVKEGLSENEFDYPFSGVLDYFTL